MSSATIPLFQKTLSQLRKRDGRVVPFDADRIERALRRCFDDCGGEPTLGFVKLVEMVTNLVRSRLNGVLPSVEVVQDAVETVLLSAGELEAVRHYIRYRDERTRTRQDRPISPEIRAAFQSSKEYFPHIIQEVQFYDKYSRFDYNKSRRETWEETTMGRAIPFLRELVGDREIPSHIFPTIERAVLHMRVIPSMRLLAMAGPAARRNNVSIFNCAFLPVKDLDCFVEAMSISMAGCGVGFSVEEKHVRNLPRIAKQTRALPYIFEIQDSQEGWEEALRFGLYTWFDGGDVTFDFSRVRPAGMVLRTKGGRASGPEPLKRLLDFARAKIISKQGSFLSTLEAHDIMCAVGGAAVAGGTRRTAMLSAFDADDRAMIHCKDGDLMANQQRWNANNSSVWATKRSQVEVMEQLIDMHKGERGEPGILSRYALEYTIPERRLATIGALDDIGINPCMPGWAPLLTRDGLRPLAEVQIGTEIWSGKDGWTRLVNKWSTGHKQVNAYHTRAGVFYGTDNHRVVCGGVKVAVKDAESIDLCIGPAFHTKTWDAQAVVDGVVLGDGSVHKASNSLVYVCVGKHDQDYHQSEIATYLPNARPGLSDTAWTVHTSILASELPKTYLREIPDRFFYGTPHIVASFLRGLYSANGSVCGDRVTLKTSSRRLVTQVQVLLSSLGIASYHTTNTAHAVAFQNGVYTCRESYDVNIGTLRGKQRFAQGIGFLQSYKNQALEVLLSKPRGVGGAEKQSYEVVACETLEIEEVFDLTVETDSHVFWSTGHLISNCGEIWLKPFEFCNLSAVICREHDTQEDLVEKIKIAAWIGTLQSLATNFPTLRDDWRKNCEEERLLGVDLNGQMDCPAVRDASVLALLRETAVCANRELAAALGVNPAAAVTCVKPSGNSSTLLGCSSGLHARYAKFYIRRLRLSAHSPVYFVLRDAGVPLTPENGQSPENATTWVASFPIRSPEGARTRHDLSALQQLDHWKLNKIHYTEHNPSITVYYHPKELLDICSWVWSNQEILGGISFLPVNDAKYDQMPYEEITEEEYERLFVAFPTGIDFSKLLRYEQEDYTTVAGEVSCAGGVCELGG